MNTYFNRRLWHLAFIHLFPYYIDVFEDGEPERHMSLQAWIKHLLLQANGAFSEDPSFIFVAFQILQLRNVCWATKGVTTKAAFRKFAAVADTVTPDQMRAAVEKISIKSKGLKMPAAATGTVDDAINQFVGQVKLAGGNVALSDFEKTKYRRRLFGLMVSLGTPLFFATLNPRDLDHPLFAFLAGLIDSITDPLPDRQSHVAAVGRNPVAASRFFAILVDMYQRHLLQKDVFGKLSGWGGTVENFGRGSHHFHVELFCMGKPRTLARYVRTVLSYSIIIRMLLNTAQPTGTKHTH